MNRPPDPEMPPLGPFLAAAIAVAIAAALLAAEPPQPQPRDLHRQSVNQPEGE